MRIDDLDFGAAVPSPNDNDGAEKAKQLIKQRSRDEPAADGYTREHEDAMPASWWDGDSGAFVPPPEKPPSRKAAATDVVQAALPSLRTRGHR